MFPFQRYKDMEKNNGLYISLILINNLVFQPFTGCGPWYPFLHTNIRAFKSLGFGLIEPFVADIRAALVMC